MTAKEIQELKKMMKEVNKMRDIAEKVEGKIFDIHMRIWRKTMNKGVE